MLGQSASRHADSLYSRRRVVDLWLFTVSPA